MCVLVLKQRSNWMERSDQKMHVLHTLSFWSAEPIDVHLRQIADMSK